MDEDVESEVTGLIVVGELTEGEEEEPWEGGVS